MNKELGMKQQAGFTLIELMIALVLGLLVVAAAGGLFLSNRRVFDATSAVNRMQENARASYEMLSRDIREAGGNPCSPNVVSMLPPDDRAAFQGWNGGVSGTEGGTSTRAAPKPDSITLHSANMSEMRVISQDGPSADLQVSSNAGIQVGDVMMVCNPQVSSLFKVTGLPSNGMAHNSGSGGNIIKPFQMSQKDVDEYPSGNSDGYCFTTKDGNAPAADGSNTNPNCLVSGNSPASVVRPVSIRWEVADNANGGKSLFRTETMAGGGRQLSRDEIAAGVVDMQLRYKLTNSANLVDATAVAAANAWAQVTAVQVTLDIEPENGAVSGRGLEGVKAGEKLRRTTSTMVALRNRQEIMQ